MFVCFDFIRTQSHHSSPFWNIFVEIEMNFCYWTCENNVCPDLWVRWEELSLMSKIDVFSPQAWDSPIMHENWQVYIHRHEKILCHGSTCCKNINVDNSSLQTLFTAVYFFTSNNPFLQSVIYLFYYYCYCLCSSGHIHERQHTRSYCKSRKQGLFPFNGQHFGNSFYSTVFILR